MKMHISFILSCGSKRVEEKEYFWNTGDEKQNQVEISRYESFLSFNRVGNYLHCEEHNTHERISVINVRVLEFDARKELV